MSEFVGLFLVMAGGTVLGYAAYKALDYLRLRKFNKFISRLRNIPKDVFGKEISEFTFRDKNGNFATVKIVVDHGLDYFDKSEVTEMICRGDAGVLGSILDVSAIEEEKMNKVQEFVFSPAAIKDLREAGLEPDDVVIKMLRASGRML
jgi:hypothetical protein